MNNWNLSLLRHRICVIIILFKKILTATQGAQFLKYTTRKFNEY
jgi:hypothetical protein